MGQKYVYNPLTCEYDIINEGAPGVPGPRGPVGGVGPAGRGIAEGGLNGQVLAKASDDDYDTEWVDQSGGGGGSVGTLAQVLTAGNDAYDKEIVLYKGWEYGVLRHNELLFFEDSPAYGGTSIKYAYIMLSPDTVKRIEIDADDVSLTLVNESLGTFKLGVDPNDGANGSVLLPTTTGAETLATREWVTANAGGGTTPNLDQVLTEHNESAIPIVITDGLGQENNSISMSSVSISTQSGLAMLAGDQVSLSPDGVITAELSGQNGLSLITQNMDTYALKGDPNPTGGGTVYLPGTSAPETLATREWVTNNGSGTPAYGDTSSRPAAPTIAEQYFDTTLGKPIWYDGSQWVDATGTGV